MKIIRKFAGKGHKLTRKEKKLWNTLLFLVRLSLLSVPLYLVLWLNLSLVPMQNVIADQSVWVLNTLGFDAGRIQNNNLLLKVGGGDTFSDPFIFFIGPDCTGWKSMLFYFALIFATLGVALKKRILGLIIGIPLIYLGNLTRIVLVVVVERAYGLDAAIWIHDWLWQAGLMALVLGVWLIWLKFEKVGLGTLSLWKFLENKIKK